MKLTDLHCDTALACFDGGKSLWSNDLQVDLKRGARLEGYTQVFAVWIDDCYRGEAAQKRFLDVYGFLKRSQEQYQDRFVLCASCGELEQARKEGKIAGILSIESGAALGGELDRLTEYFHLGVRMMTLTWNGATELAGGCHAGGGLTRLGRECLLAMERLGIALDVSHLSREGFWEALKVYGGPVCASHSNADAVFPHVRNLTDEQLQRIAHRGGVAGINYYPVFLNGTKQARYPDFLAHAAHMIRVGGEELPALGGDFDGADLGGDVSELSDLPVLYERFAAAFHSYRLADRIFHENADRFLKEALTNRPGNSKIL